MEQLHKSALRKQDAEQVRALQVAGTKNNSIVSGMAGNGAGGAKPLRLRAFALMAFFVFGLLAGLFAAAPASAQAFSGPGGSGTDWIQMFRGNYSGDWTTRSVGDIWQCITRLTCGAGGGDAPIADPGASKNYMNALRLALAVYSNALLIVASIILLYHLLIMTTETAHHGVAGGKRANQVWAPIRLVMAISLLVPLSSTSGLNSAQYITLQIIEWGSNMATTVWSAFVTNAGTGTGSDPTMHPPDTGSIAREAAKIGACMHIYNGQMGVTKEEERVTMRPYPPAILWGTKKEQALCGSVIIYALSPASILGFVGITQVIDQMETPAAYFTRGKKEYEKEPKSEWLPTTMNLAALAGLLESMGISMEGSWNNSEAEGGTGWVGAGAYFLNLAAGGSNRVSSTDTLPIIMGPQATRLPQFIKPQYYGMAAWIVGNYTAPLSGGAGSSLLGNTVAGRKFVDFMLLLLDMVGVTSGLWSPPPLLPGVLPAKAAFIINMNNSPLAEMVDLGHRMIRTALDFVGYAVEIGLNEPQHNSYKDLSRVDADGKQLGQNNKEAGSASGAIFSSMVIPIMTAAATSLLTMGILIGIFAPLLPFVKFTLSVLTWLVSVLETMVCAPLLALAYLTPYGDGFGGQKAEPGYYLVMHAFLRPVMTIFGLIASILLFNIAAYLVTVFYYSIASQAGTFQGGMYVVTKIAFGMMYVSVLYLCLNSALKVMDTFGKHSTRWLGGQSHEEFMGDGQQATSMAQQGVGAVTGVTQGGYFAGYAGSNLTSAGGKEKQPVVDPGGNVVASAGSQFGANGTATTAKRS